MAMNRSDLTPIYEYGFSIPRDQLEAILQTERSALIAELLAVLEKAQQENIGVARTGTAMPEDGFAAIHSLNLLSHLKAAEALPQVASFLQIPNDRLKLFLGDYLAKGLWEVLWQLFRHGWQELHPVLLHRVVGEEIKRAVLQAWEQIAWHLPGFRDGILDALGDWMEGYLSGQYSIPPALAGEWVRVVVDLRGRNLLPLITRLYEKGIFLGGLAGSLSEAKAYLEGPVRSHARLPDRDIFQRYAQYANQRLSQRPADTRASTSIDLPKPPRPGKGQMRSIAPKKKPLRKAAKPGRNAPCPCGSGKKYKRCCGAR